MLEILVVDDELDMIDLFRQRFRREVRRGDVSLTFAHDGESALARLSTADPPTIMLILSDINMPGMNGLELLRRVKQRWPSLPVMIMTAYGDADNRQRAMELGAVDLVAKPLDFDALKQRIHGVVAPSIPPP